MGAPDESALLAVWERGQARHPVDRALLLCAWARPDLPASTLPELPLGMVNRALLGARQRIFGARIGAFIDCPQCGERMEIVLDAGQLLAGCAEPVVEADFEAAGMRFRVPNSRDLAAVAQERDALAAAAKLLEHCCLTHPRAPDTDFATLLEEAGAVMEAMDPAADIGLELACEVCGHEWLAGFDIGALLWDEIDARARALLAEVHGLARAYGWSERDILALSPQRRAAYLDMAGA